MTHILLFLIEKRRLFCSLFLIIQEKNEFVQFQRGPVSMEFRIQLHSAQDVQEFVSIATRRAFSGLAMKKSVQQMEVDVLDAMTGI